MHNVPPNSPAARAQYQCSSSWQCLCATVRRSPHIPSAARLFVGSACAPTQWHQHAQKTNVWAENAARAGGVRRRRARKPHGAKGRDELDWLEQMRKANGAGRLFRHKSHAVVFRHQLCCVCHVGSVPLTRCKAGAQIAETASHALPRARAAGACADTPQQRAAQRRGGAADATAATSHELRTRHGAKAARQRRALVGRTVATTSHQTMEARNRFLDTIQGASLGALASIANWHVRMRKRT